MSLSCDCDDLLPLPWMPLSRDLPPLPWKASGTPGKNQTHLLQKREKCSVLIYRQRATIPGNTWGDECAQKQLVTSILGPSTSHYLIWVTDYIHREISFGQSCSYNNAASVVYWLPHGRSGHRKWMYWTFLVNNEQYTFAQNTISSVIQPSINCKLIFRKYCKWLPNLFPFTPYSWIHGTQYIILNA